MVVVAVLEVVRPLVSVSPRVSVWLSELPVLVLLEVLRF